MAFQNVLQGRLGFDAPARARQPQPVPKQAKSDSDPLPPPPEFRGERRIILNAETTGLKWWAGDVPAGWSYYLPESGKYGYLPIRHDGGNLPIEQVHAWLRDIRGMHVENTNTRFDLHMSREDGVDLIEGTGNTFGDCAHYAALLDDNRMRFNLDGLSKDYLDWDVNDPADPLGPLPTGITSEGEWHKLHASRVAPYAIRNVEQVRRLVDLFTPMIDEQNLNEVLQLEQEIIPVVVEMERNGTYLDMDLLERWQREATAELEDHLFKIYQLTGVSLKSPDSSKDIEKLFKARGIPIIVRTETGAPSFSAAVLNKINDECIVRLRKAGQLADLKSKYLDKYAAAMRQSDGWLRFNLHQLRYGKDEGERFGTVSGRFSAAGDKHLPPDGFGTGAYNPQQVVAVEKQLERGWCPDYVVRKLFKLNFAADMMQIEYRLFADYADAHQIYHDRPASIMVNGKRVWIAGPLADFHAGIAVHLQKINPNLNRKLVKNINFATIYGAGTLKFTMMIGLIDEQTYQGYVDQFSGRARVRDLLLTPHANQFKQALDIRKAYDRVLPKVHDLLTKAGRLAEERGYVRTLMGRRARPLTKFHSALNRIIQGGAADVNKKYLVHLYHLRKELGLTLRLTVHDEVAGTLAGPLGPVKRALNTQLFDLKVPILWDAKVGDNWAACK